MIGNRLLRRLGGLRRVFVGLVGCILILAVLKSVNQTESTNSPHHSDHESAKIVKSDTNNRGTRFVLLPPSRA